MSAARRMKPSRRAALRRARLRDDSCDGAGGGFEVYALSVHYGQRHGAELLAAARVAAALGAREHRVMRVDLAGIGGSALTDSTLAVPEAPSEGIPITYVPAATP